MSQYIDVEGMHSAARRMENAADSAQRSADRIEQAVNQLKILLDDGYGNNACKLIELLSKETQT